MPRLFVKGNDTLSSSQHLVIPERGPDNTVESSFPREMGGNQGGQSIFGVSWRGRLEEGEKGHQQAVLLCEPRTQLPSCPALSNSLFLKSQIFHGELKLYKNAITGWTISTPGQID